MKFLKIILLFLIFNVNIVFSWWDNSYIYRRQIIVNNTHLKIPEKFTLNITLNTNELINSKKIKPDCSDIRIIDSNNNLKDIVVEGCNTSKTIIYFNVDEDFRKKEIIYYLYYGNQNSTSQPSNMSNIYYFYDSFENYDVGSTPPYDGWSSTGGLWKIENKSRSGYKSVFENGQIKGWMTLNNSLINVENFTYIAYVLTGIQADVWSFGVSFCIQNSTGYRYQAIWEYQLGSGIGGWTFQLRKVLDGQYEHFPLGVVYPSNYSLYGIKPPEINKWYKFKIIRSYPNIKVFFDDKLIFDVNDSTFKSGSIGFSRYSNTNDSNRKSWYDDSIVMLYLDPWPETHLGEEEKITSVNMNVTTSDIIYIKKPEKIFINIFQENQPLSNLTINDINISIDQAFIEKVSFNNYKNGTYLIEIKSQTEYLGKKKITVTTPYKSIQKDLYILTTPDKNSIIVTNEDWKNYITAVSTNKTVLVANSSNLIDFYQPSKIFLLDNDITTKAEKYYVDRDAIALMFFMEKEIIKTNDKNIAIKSSSLHLPIIIDVEQKTIDLLKPKKIHNFTNEYQIENFYFSKLKPTNYIILANENSEKSIVASSLAFKHNGFVILSSGDAYSAKQKLKEKIYLTRYQFTDDYRFKNKVFLALIETPYFIINDPVNDGLLDFDGEKIKTDTLYSDLNDDGYLDLSVSRLEGSLEAITHQIYSEPRKNKQALIISVYDTPPTLDLFYSVPLMQYSQLLRGYLLGFGFNVTSLVEKRSNKNEYSFDDVKSLFMNIKNYIEEKNFDILLKQLRLIFSTFNEAIYVIVEFDWQDALEKMLNEKTFVLKHMPIYTEENLVTNLKNKDIVIYMAFGNKTHLFSPNSSIAISNLPNIPSFVYLYYTNSYETLSEFQNKNVISFLSSTASSYTPQTSYSSYLILKNFNGEVAYLLNNGKNEIYKYYKLIKNVSFFDADPYLKDYYSKTLYSDPAKIFDPILDVKQSDQVYFDGENFLMKIFIQPNYTIISNENKKTTYFKDAEYIDGIPIYKKTFLLPQNAIINNVSFYAEKINENIDGIQVYSNFWYDTFKLLDNRTVLEIVIIPITNRGEILTNIEVEVKYLADLEILKINAKNGILEFSVFSSSQKTAEAKILLENEKQSYLLNQSIILYPGVNNYTVNLKAKDYGLYSVELIIEEEKTVGPKYTYFYLKPSTTRIIEPIKSLKFLDYKKFFETKTSFKEKIETEIMDGKKIIKYNFGNKKLFLEISSEYLRGELSINDKILFITETNREKTYEYQSSEGKATIQISSGITKETYTTPKVMEDLREMLSEYNEILIRIKDQYT